MSTLLDGDSLEGVLQAGTLLKLADCSSASDLRTANINHAWALPEAHQVAPATLRLWRYVQERNITKLGLTDVEMAIRVAGNFGAGFLPVAGLDFQKAPVPAHLADDVLECDLGVVDDK